MENTGAILLRRTRLTETSLIISWLTPQHGRVKTVAKGALRSASPFRGKLDLFYHCEILFSASRSSDLHTLRELVLLRTFEGIRTAYARLAAASYFAELVEQCTEPMDPLPEIYDLLLRALQYLEEKSVTRRAVLHFEAQLAKMLGLHNGEKGSRAASDILGASHPMLRKTRENLWTQLEINNFPPQNRIDNV